VQIFLALQNEPHVRNVMLERPLGTNRPYVSAEIDGVLVVAITPANTTERDGSQLLLARVLG
jgi:hypothetical protein